MRCKYQKIACAVIWAGLLSIDALAQQNQDDKRWASWLLAISSKLPAMQSLDNSNKAAEWDYKAGKKPLYNPELELDYDDSDVQEYGVGIRQTLDFSGKRKAFSAKADANYTLAKIGITQKKENILANAVHALIGYEEAKSLLALVEEQERILGSMQKIIVKRQQVGDVSQLDVDLSLLSLSENLQRIAELEIAFNRAKAELYATLAIDDALFPVPSGKLWQSGIVKQNVNIWLQKSPAFIAAQQTVAVTRSAVSLAKANKKSDPTIGLRAINERYQDYVAVSISFPINIRNSYSAEYRAAQERLLQAELEFTSVRREIAGDLVEKQNNYLSQLKHWLTWQSLGVSSTADSRKRIEQQWAIGDISTSEYLFVLQQQANASLAGLRLESSLEHAWVEWLLSTLEVESWLNKIKTRDQLTAKVLRGNT